MLDEIGDSWQQTQNPVIGDNRVGSIPSSGISYSPYISEFSLT